jgi:hypothetical protein
MIQTEGKVYEQRGVVYVKTSRPAVDNLSDEVTVVWSDNRHRTAEQNRKAWALMSEIAAFMGEEKDVVYKQLALDFTAKNLETLQGMLFHLSTASMSEASNFITMLVNLIIEYDIPTKEPLYTLCEDEEKYTYACLMNKKCCVCGKKAELHHCDGSRIGMGYNRETKPQLGAMVMPLCRVHHTEYHTIGGTAFGERYHVVSVPMDKRIAQKYNITGRAAS